MSRPFSFPALRLAACLSAWLLLTQHARGQAGDPKPSPAAPPAAAAAAVLGAPVIATRLLPDERIRLDGTLGHPAWQRAPAHAGFVQKFPEAGPKPPHE